MMFHAPTLIFRLLAGMGTAIGKQPHHRVAIYQKVKFLTSAELFLGRPQPFLKKPIKTDEHFGGTNPNC